MDRLKLLAVDGLAWKLIDRFRPQGFLPNFSRMIRTGVSGVLSCRPVRISTGSASRGGPVPYQGLLSPVIWTSIASGKSPAHHGIGDFVDATGRLHDANDVRCPRIWDHLADGGISSGVLGWMLTHPAPRVNGFLVSDRFAAPGGSYPPDLPAVRRPLPGFETLRGELAALTPFFPRPDYSEAFDEDSAEFRRHQLVTKRLFPVFRHDRELAGMARELLGASGPRFGALYLRGIDNACHAFWGFMDPGGWSQISDEDADLFGGVIPAYYRWVDGVLGEWLDSAGPDDRVLVVSDHGFRAGDPSKYRTRGDLNNRHLTGDHDDDGVILAAGAGIAPGRRVEERNVLDVAPTILHAFGLSVPEDMEGEVIPEIAGPGPIRFRPAAASTTPGAIPGDAYAPAEHAALIADLKDLGYL